MYNSAELILPRKQDCSLLREESENVPPSTDGEHPVGRLIEIGALFMNQSSDQVCMNGTAYTRDKKMNATLRRMQPRNYRKVPWVFKHATFSTRCMPWVLAQHLSVLTVNDWQKLILELLELCRDMNLKIIIQNTVFLPESERVVCTLSLTARTSQVRAPT